MLTKQKHLNAGVLAVSLALLLASCETSMSLLSPPHSLGTAMTRGMADMPTSFFDYSDARLDTIIMALQKVETEAPFVAAFTEEYGVPLWDMSYCITEKEGTCFLVPLWKQGEEKRIETLWYFRRAGDFLKYFPIRRTTSDIQKDEQQEFMFGLLSYLVFGKYNADEQYFVNAETPRTRMTVIITECWDVYTGPEYKLEYQYTNCVDRYVWLEDARPPFGGGSGDSGKYGMGDLYLPGGGPQGNDPSKAKNLFENKELSESDWEEINKLLEEIAKDCMGENLYNAVKDSLGNEKITFKFTDEKTSWYSDKEKTLYLSETNIKSGTLLHELFHVFQIYQEEAASINNSIMNKEIEAHLAQYKYLRKNKKLNELEKKWDRRWTAVKHLDEKIDSHGNLLRDKRSTDAEYAFQEELFEITIEYNVVPTFRKNGYEEATFDNTLGYKNTFLNINHLTINCN